MNYCLLEAFAFDLKIYENIDDFFLENNHDMVIILAEFGEKN